MISIKQVVRRPSSVARPSAEAARNAALEARNQIIRDAIARLAPTAQAIVIDSYERAYPGAQ